MENVAYIESEDINSDGTLKSYICEFNSGTAKPVVLMAQGNFCGYCQQAKPAFKQLAQTTPNIVAATIVIDGEQSEKEAAKFLKKWDPNYRGVPIYLGFDSDGRIKNVHQGGRDVESLKSFAASL